MLNSIPGKDPCPNCGELLRITKPEKTFPHTWRGEMDDEGRCISCKMSIQYLERTERLNKKPVPIRADGFYWVRFHSDWEIARRWNCGRYWSLCGDSSTHDMCDLEEIGNKVER